MLRAERADLVHFWEASDEEKKREKGTLRNLSSVAPLELKPFPPTGKACGFSENQTAHFITFFFSTLDVG